MIYQIYNLENNIIYEFKIEELLNFIKNNFKCTFYKIINNQHIKINNNIILNTIFIIHRINTINELLDIDKQFGVEIDIRNNNDNIILSHDPFNENNCDIFEKYLENYDKNLLILNIKSERLELKCI